MSFNLFTYGVLMYDELLTLLTGKEFTSMPAVLPNHQRLTLVKDGWPRIPVVVPEESSSVRGVVIKGLDEVSIKILDEFEDTEIDLYKRSKSIAILNSGAKIEVNLYVGGASAKECLSEEWHSTKFVDAHFDEYKNEIIPDFLKNRRVT